MNKVAVCHNVTNNTDIILGVNQIKEMVPVNNGDPYIRVDYYDFEMCVNLSMWCDNIKFEIREDEEIL